MSDLEKMYKAEACQLRKEFRQAKEIIQSLTTQLEASEDELKAAVEVARITSNLADTLAKDLEASEKRGVELEKVLEKAQNLTGNIQRELNCVTPVRISNSLHDLRVILVKALTGSEPIQGRNDGR